MDSGLITVVAPRDDDSETGGAVILFHHQIAITVTIALDPLTRRDRKRA